MNSLIKSVFGIVFLMLFNYGALGALMTPWGEKVTAENAWREYPRPQLVRDNWTNLNGYWDYSIVTNAGLRLGEVTKGKILVPFCFESSLSGVGRIIEPKEKMVYTRKFNAQKKNGKRLLLNFEAVDWRTQVFINGIEAMDAPHENGNQAFSVDITKFIKNGENDLKVVAWDPTHTFVITGGKQNDKSKGCFYTRVSGIWQTVWMEEVPDNYIKSYHVVTDIDRGEVRFTFKASGDITEDVEIDVFDAEGRRVATAENEADEGVVVKMPRNFKLWSPSSPYLYTFKARFDDDKFDGYFGMRKIERAKDAKGVWRFRLNNEFIFPIGTLDQGWWPDGLLTPPSVEACEFDIKTLKKCGFNMLRKHIKVEPRIYYYLCDKIGILLFQDAPSPVGHCNLFNLEKSLQRYGMFRREWKEEIDTLRNHPSIVMWIPYNEAWGQPDVEYTDNTLRWTKRYDPTRLVGGPSGWSDYEGGDMVTYPETALVRDPDIEESADPASDVVDNHTYPGPAQCRQHKHRISLLGEFGGLGLRIPGHIWDEKNSWGYANTGKVASREDNQKHYLELMEKLYPLIDTGLAGAVYTQTTDVETEINGLMTYDRKVFKYDFDVLVEAHRKVVERADKVSKLK